MSEQELGALSVKELRKILQGRGVEYGDCIEKSDLVKRVIETQHIKSSIQLHVYM